VRSHGIVAAAFAVVFYLETFGISVPLLSLEAQHPNVVPTHYSKAACLFAAVAITTFSVYGIFPLPELSARYQAKLKTLFFAYHLPWCAMIIYVALMPEAAWNAWLSVAVMVGFTLWGAVAQPDAAE
jgi:hypothetical protein